LSFRLLEKRIISKQNFMKVLQLYKSLLFLLVILVACNKQDDIDKPLNSFDTQHKPLIYLIDYIKEDGKTIISWKYNARYEFIKSVHLKNTAGDEIAEIDFPVDHFELNSSYNEKIIIIQAENFEGQFHDKNILSLDKDQEYEQLLEKEPIKRVLVDKSAAMPFFYQEGDNAPFLLFGANYIRLRGQDSRLKGSHSTFDAATPSTLADYNPYHAETLFRTLKSRGFNFVRVFLIGRSMVNPGISGPISLNKPVYGPYMDNFIDFLERARKYGIYVFPTLGDGELPNNAYWRSKIPAGHDINFLRLYFPFVKEAVDAKAEYLQAVVSYIKNNDPTLIKTLFAIELQNEYALNANVWPFTQMSGSFKAYWGETYDMADKLSRQKLAEDATVLYQNKMVEALKEIEPELLVCEGFFTLSAVGKNPETAAGLLPGSFKDERYPPVFDVTVKSDIDFIDIHHYPTQKGAPVNDQFNHAMNSMLNDKTSLNDILKKKPMILGEFGAFYETETGNIANTAKRMNELAKLAMSKGFDGWCYWTFDTFEQERILNMMDEEQEIMDALSHP
jgi:hypothetical protein